MFATFFGMAESMSAATRRDDVLFYLHVPKTGGISLTKILDERFSREEIFPVPDQLEPTKMFGELSQDQLAKIRFVRGHFWFGPGDGAVHDYLSANPLTITIMRHPVERVISVFRYIAAEPDHWLSKLTIEPGTDIAGFVQHPWAQSEIKDLQTRLVAGHTVGHPIVRPPGQAPADQWRIPDDELIDRAKQRIDGFAFVGLTERFEESVDLLCRQLDWDPVDEVPRLNVSTTSVAREPVSEAVRAAIAERNQLDMELYEHARNRFENQLADAVIARSGRRD